MQYVHSISVRAVQSLLELAKDMPQSDPAILESKVRNAAEVTRAFSAFLEGVKLLGWAQRFVRIAERLEAQDVSGALHLQKQERFNGPGSLSDVMLDDQQVFDRLWGAQSRTMGNLRLYVDYGKDRPPVVI